LLCKYAPSLCFSATFAEVFNVITVSCQEYIRDEIEMESDVAYAEGVHIDTQG